MNEPAAPPLPRRRELSVEDYADGVLGGNVSRLARALTLIESSSPRHQPQAEQLLARLLPHSGGSTRVGITGVPGVGKSTFIESLGMLLVERGHQVAVLAVDPSSGVSGGSILGDKTRMARLSTTPQAFIRPSPSAGTLGGVARKTRESLLVCEAAGFDVVLVETVGVGQSETVVSEMTDCFLALMLPGAGDELQGIKRGLMELVDLIAVNKADGPTKTAAEFAAGQYRNALKSLVPRGEHPTQVFTCSAAEQKGLDTVWEAVERRQAALENSGGLARLRQGQNLRWLWAMVDDQLRHAVSVHPAVQAIRPELEEAVLSGALPVITAARRILAAFGEAS